MEQKYLIDTNVLIAFQSSSLSPNGMDFMSNVIDNHFNISFITYIEYLSFKSITNEAIEFIELSNIVEVNKKIIKSTIIIRQNKSIKLPDAIIAATAINTNSVLLTRNIKDFKNIDALQISNPFDIF